MKSASLPRLALFALGLLGLGTTGTIAQEAAASQDDGRLLIRAGTVHLGNGEVRQNVLIAIENGKITGLANDEPQRPNEEFGAARVLDLRTRTLIPGLVAAYSARAAQDNPYNLSPDVRAGENVDLFEDDEQLAEAGVTTIYLSPGQRRLLPGIGSVIKTAGPEGQPEARVLRMDAALRITLSPASRQDVPAVYEPVMSPTSDEPLEPARRQLGTARSSQLELLERAFEEARTTDAEYGGDGPVEWRYRLDPLRQALAGRLPVRLMASSAADIVHGLDFCERLGLKVVLELPSEADAAVARLASQQIPVVVSLPLRPGRTLPGDFDPEDPRLRLPSPGQAGALVRAGVRVALVPSAEDDIVHLRAVAGLASRFGLPRDRALRAVTLDAARALGVEERVGSIEKGKDADFVVLTGAPFDSRSRVVKVLVDGRVVHEADAPSTIFALRVGRLLRGDGSEERDALLVVRDGRIHDAGSAAALPPGCQLHELPGAVLVPGYVDAASRLGLHVDATQGIPGRVAPIPAKTDVDVAGALDPEDEAFALARAAGVTSVFVTPDDSGLVGPRVAAVRTGGDGEHFVVREIAGLRMQLPQGGEQAEKQLLAAIDKAKKYFEAKNAPAKEEEKKEETPEKSEPAQPEDPISGTWSGTLTGPAPQPLPLRATLKLEGKDVTGQFSAPMFPQAIPVKGTWAAPKLTLTAELPGVGKLTFSAEVKGQKMSGKVTGGPAEAEFELTRQGEGAKPAQPASAPKKAAKDPKLDENLEPFGPVLRKEIPVVVRFKGRDAAQTAVDAILKKSGLRLVLAAATPGDLVEIAKEPLDLPADTRVGLLLTIDELVYEKDDVRVNLAQYLASKGFDPILVSRAQTGTMLLPMHAAWAVAEGLDPRHALRAVTSHPAQHFGVAHEIGTLEIGKSADFVLLDGDPFDLQTRVLGVWIAGKRRHGDWPSIRAALEELK